LGICRFEANRRRAKNVLRKPLVRLFKRGREPGRREFLAYPSAKAQPSPLQHTPEEPARFIDGNQPGILHARGGGPAVDVKKNERGVRVWTWSKRLDLDPRSLPRRNAACQRNVSGKEGERHSAQIAVWVQRLRSARRFSLHSGEASRSTTARSKPDVEEPFMKRQIYPYLNVRKEIL